MEEVKKNVEWMWYAGTRTRAARHRVNGLWNQHSRNTSLLLL